MLFANPTVRQWTNLFDTAAKSLPCVPPPAHFAIGRELPAEEPERPRLSVDRGR